MTPTECHWTSPVKSANDAGQARNGRQLRRRCETGPTLYSTPRGGYRCIPSIAERSSSGRAAYSPGNSPLGRLGRTRWIFLPSLPGERTLPDRKARRCQSRGRESARFLGPQLGQPGQGNSDGFPWPDFARFLREPRFDPRGPPRCTSRRMLGLIPKPDLCHPQP